MKTLYNFLYLSLPVLFLLPSCSTDECNELNQQGEEMAITLLATQGDFETPTPTTRTQIDRWYPGEGNNLKGVQIKWSTHDMIGVYGHSNKNLNLPFTYDGEPSLEAAFKGTLKSTYKNSYWIYTAYYPYYSDADESNILAPIPSNQSYSDQQSIAKYDYKAFYSDGTSTTGTGSNRTVQVKFEQLATLLRFVIDDYDIRNWLVNIQNKKLNKEDRLETITFSSTTNAITGDFSYNMNKRSRDLVLGSQATAENKTMTLTVAKTTTETIKSGEQFEVAYAIVAPIAEDQLNLSFKYGNHIVTLAPVSTKDSLKRGVLYNIGLNAKSLSKASVESLSEPLTPSGKSDGNEFQNGGSAF